MPHYFVESEDGSLFEVDRREYSAAQTMAVAIYGSAYEERALLSIDGELRITLLASGSITRRVQ